jgi:hypothetical protein
MLTALHSVLRVSRYNINSLFEREKTKKKKVWKLLKDGDENHMAQ